MGSNQGLKHFLLKSESEMAPMEPLSASPIKKKQRPIVAEKSYFRQTLSTAEWADLAEISFPTKFRRLLKKQD